jgi:hypothetical protein
MAVWQLDNELGLTLNRMDFANDFQGLTAQGMMGNDDLNALFLSVIQCRILLVGV